MSDALDQHHIRAIEALNDRIRELEDVVRDFLDLTEPAVGTTSSGWIASVRARARTLLTKGE